MEHWRHLAWNRRTARNNSVGIVDSIVLPGGWIAELLQEAHTCWHSQAHGIYSAMALTFPNHSRSYDETGKRVRFTGYDGMFEIPFFVEIEALEKRMKSPAGTEAGYLAAFDDARAEITTAAKAIYRKGGHTPFILTADSF